MTPTPKTLTLLASCLALLAAGQAQAHARLLSAAPAAGGETRGSPAELRLTFSEGVIAKLSGAVVKDASGKPAGAGAASSAPGDRKKLIVPLAGALSPGVYTVSWHAVSPDTHRTVGQYRFTVR
jgi:methionine-rich copper-binding protein CopC